MPAHWLRRSLSPSPAVRFSKTKPAQGRGLRLEALEGRWLMAADPITGMGVAGDSLSDEYAYESYNYATNWVEALAEQTGMNFGDSGSFGEPRRTGYEFNWARVNANSATLLSQGQPFGLAQQIEAGEVSHVVLSIGPNDFQPNPLGGAYSSIYNQRWTQAQINSYVDQVVGNITTAVERLDGTGAQIVVSNILDFGIAPFTKQYFSRAANRERVSTVINTVNSRLSQMAEDHNVVLVDLNGLAKQLLGTSSLSKSSWTIGGVKVTNTAGTGPTNSFVSDKIHPHTLLQSQVANLFLHGFNVGYGTPVDLFTEREAVALEGLAYVRDTLGLNFASYVDTYTNAAPTLSNLPEAVQYSENAAPELVASAANLSDADNLNFAGGALTVTLSGADSSERLTIQAANGISLSANVVKYGADAIGTFTGGVGSQPLVVTFNGSALAAGVQSLVRSIGFNTLGDRPATTPRSVTFNLSDGDGASSVSPAVSIGVKAINDPPVLNMSSSMTYFEDAPAVVLSSGPTVTDPDSDDFAGAVLRVANTNGDADDRLEIGSQITASGMINLAGDDVLLDGVAIGEFSGGGGLTPLTVMFNESATLTSALAVVRNVTFRARTNEPSTTTRAVEFQLTDGDGGASDPFTKSVKVALVNDKPSLSLGGNINSPENSEPRLLASGAVLTDPDSDFDGGVLTVTTTVNATDDDRLSIRPGTVSVSGSEVSYAGQVIGTFSGGNGATPLVVTLNANASRLATEALVRSIAFQTLGDAPTTATRTVTFKVSDGDGGVSNVPFKTVTVAASNDAPLLSGGGSVGYTRDTAAIALTPTATVVDPDNELFTGGMLSVALSSGVNDAFLSVGGTFTVSDDEVLLGDTVIGALSAAPGIANAPLQITFTSAATRSIVEQLVRSIRFRTQNATAQESRTASFSLTDGSGGTSNDMFVSVQIS